MPVRPVGNAAIAFTTTLAATAIFICCGGDSYDEAPGNESGPCFANRTCNPGLSCASDRCVRIGGSDGGGTGQDGAQTETGTPTGGGGCSSPNSPPAIKCGANGAIECAAGDSCCVEEGVCKSGSSSCNGAAIKCVSTANCGSGNHCCAAASLGSAVDACPAHIVSVEGSACRSECADSEIELCFAGAVCGDAKKCTSATLVLGPAAASFEIATGVCR